MNAVYTYSIDKQSHETSSNKASNLVTSINDIDDLLSTTVEGLNFEVGQLRILIDSARKSSEHIAQLLCDAGRLRSNYSDLATREKLLIQILGGDVRLNHVTRSQKALAIIDNFLKSVIENGTICLRDVGIATAPSSQLIERNS